MHLSIRLSPPGTVSPYGRGLSSPVHSRFPKTGNSPWLVALKGVCGATGHACMECVLCSRCRLGCWGRLGGQPGGQGPCVVAHSRGGAGQTHRLRRATERTGCGREAGKQDRDVLLGREVRDVEVLFPGPQPSSPGGFPFVSKGSTLPRADAVGERTPSDVRLQGRPGSLPGSGAPRAPAPGTHLPGGCRTDSGTGSLLHRRWMCSVL